MLSTCHCATHPHAAHHATSPPGLFVPPAALSDWPMVATLAAMGEALREGLAACREYEATLLVDVAHDLGAVGPSGTGIVGLQGLLGKVDLVIGSFSKVFALTGYRVGAIVAGTGFIDHAAKAMDCVAIDRRAA